MEVNPPQCLNPTDPDVIEMGETSGCIALDQTNSFPDYGGEYGGNVFAVDSNCNSNGTVNVYASTACEGAPTTTVKRICVAIYGGLFQFCCGENCIAGVEVKRT